MTTHLKGTFMEAPLSKMNLSLFKVRSLFILGLWCFKKCGFETADLFYRSDSMDAPMDVVVIWRTQALKDTYSDWTPSEEDVA